MWRFAFCPPQALPVSRSSRTPHSVCTRQTVSLSGQQEQGDQRAQIPCASLPSIESTVRRVAAFAAAALLTFTPITVHDFIAHAARGGGDTFLSASGDVNKDAESLLRWSLPIRNKPVRELQAALESVITNTRGLKWARMDADLKRASMLVNTQSEAIIYGVTDASREEATQYFKKVKEGLPLIDAALQERNADKVVLRDKDVLRELGKVEELMVQKFPYQVPQEYSNLPQLKGRAVVEITVRKNGDDNFDIDGNLFKDGKMTVVVDGYSAPVNAGAFVDLVNRNFYDGLPIIRSDGFIIQTGKPETSDGYIDEATGELRTVPLEVFAKGDSLPLYGMTLEDDGRGTAGTVLPFSAYGTLAMARKEFEPNTGSSQFFWFLFEPDLTPAGRNLLDGSWSVVGYTTKGQKFLKGLQKGDRIVSAKVVDGLQYLVMPDTATSDT